jgi:hypothetical protein
MSEYYFETKEFGASERGIHLLRSRYNYETFNYTDIATAAIERGKEINNWLFALIIGVGMVGFAIFYTIRMLNVISNSEMNVVYIEEIIVPLIPFLMGSYLIYSSFKTGITLKITMSAKSKRLSLNELMNSNKLEEFQTLLRDKLQSKLTINI